MAVEIVMPKWGLSMQEGTISNWLKAEGEAVEEGEELVEIETEKITNVVESPASGILAKIVQPQGATVEIKKVIAIIAAPGEDISDIDMSGDGAAVKETEEAAQEAATPASAAATADKSQDDGGRVRAMPVARKMAEEHGLDLATITGTGRGGTITRSDVELAIAAKKPDSGPVKAMPAARRLAKEKNIDLETLTGTGPNGTITVNDVKQAASESNVRPVHKVNFYSDGHKLAGILYSPKDAQPGDKCPAVVMCVGYTYLKEMVMPDIARQLTKAGYVALSFDYRGFGESEGPRHRLIPHEQVADVRNAITYVAAQPHVDPERIAVIGVSLGGSHAITVAATDERVEAAVALEPMGDGERWLKSLRRHSEWMEFRQRVQEDRVQRVKTGQSERVDPFDIVLPDPASKAFLEGVSNEFPQMQCTLPLETADWLLEYSPEEVIEDVDVPLLIVHGAEDRLVPVDEVFEMVDLADEDFVELVVVPGMDHFSWVMPHSDGFTLVSDLIMEFFEEMFPVL